MIQGVDLKGSMVIRFRDMECKPCLGSPPRHPAPKVPGSRRVASVRSGAHTFAWRAQGGFKQGPGPPRPSRQLAGQQLRVVARQHGAAARELGGRFLAAGEDELLGLGAQERRQRALPL